mgnify:CR=1 FL=1
MNGPAATVWQTLPPLQLPFLPVWNTLPTLKRSSSRSLPN